MRVVALLVVLAGCASAPPTKPDPMRRLKKLHRQTYCGGVTVQVELIAGPVVTELRVCAARQEACQAMLRSFAAPAAEVEDIVFDWESCRPTGFERVEAPERKLLKSRP